MILTRYPAIQYSGAQAGGWPTYVVEVPPIFGSVSDDSDTTFVEIEADFVSGAENSRHTGLLSVEFDPLPPGTVPTHVGLFIRAKNGASFPEGEVTFYTQYVRAGQVDLFDWYDWTTSADVTLGPLAAGTVTIPTDFYFFDNGTPFDQTGADLSGWYELSPTSPPGTTGYEFYQALTSDGLRVDFLAEQASGLTPNPPRRPYFDIYEVRLLVMVADPAGRRLVPLRGRQRGDGLGASSAPRGRQHTTRQASLRGNGIL